MVSITNTITHETLDLPNVFIDVCVLYRMDENYNILPHGVNFQDAIFPDTPENKRLFSSLFQFSNCSAGQTVYNFNSDWESQEDSRVQLYHTHKELMSLTSYL